MSTYADVLRVALNLTSEERSDLAGALIESLHDEEAEGRPVVLSDEWQREIADRSAEYARGDATPVSWEQVRERILQKYGDDV